MVPECMPNQNKETTVEDFGTLTKRGQGERETRREIYRK